MRKQNLQREINWPRSLGWVLAELHYTPEILLLAFSSLYLCLYQDLSASSFLHILCMCVRVRKSWGRGGRENKNKYESIII